MKDAESGRIYVIRLYVTALPGGGGGGLSAKPGQLCSRLRVD